MSVGENIKELRRARGLTQLELAKAVGVSDKAVSAWETGIAEPRMGPIQRMSDYFCVPIAVLVDDEGLIALDPVTKRYHPRPTYATAPLYGTIAAGVPIEAIQIDGEVPIPEDVLSEHPHAFFLRVQGESMNRVLPNGSYALIDPDSEITNGDAVALNVNGSDATIKRLHRHSSSAVLQPDSSDPSFTDTILDYTKPGTVSLTLIGRVVWYVAPYGERL